MVARQSSASLFPLLLVSLLAGMAFWLEQASRPPVGANDGKARHDPDYIVEQVHLRRFDPTGALQHTLLGDRMQHYPDDDSTWVSLPRLTYHREPPTFVSAREARVDGKGEQVTLTGDVHIRRGGSSGKPDTVISTEHLDVFPDDEVATTHAPVSLVQGQSRSDGSGLHADNKTTIYVLEGPVNGVFFRNGGVSRPVPPEVPAVVRLTSPQSRKSQAKSQPSPKPKARSPRNTPAKPKPKPAPKAHR
jgi:lipopolysaccharide export system protein LptC